MSTNRLLLQRLKNAAASTYVGRNGEVTIDVLGNKLLKIHDGVTPGGANLQVAAVSAPATAQQLGSVRVGANLSITEDGVLSAEDGNYTLPTASALVKGGVKVGTNLTIDVDGVLHATDSTATDRLTSTGRNVILNSSGTLTTPLLLPKAFTAVLDNAHMTVGTSISGTPWQFAVQFQVGVDGSVTTYMDSPFPNPSNPGYVTSDEFEFVEADHGIPGYTFVITLNDVVLPGGAGWTANPAVSQPPEYPSTIKSLGAIKLTANTNSLVYGTNGTLHVQRIVTPEIEGSASGLAIYSDWTKDTGISIVSQDTLESVTLTSDRLVAISTNFGPSQHDWIFDATGKITLPAGGDIVDSNGTSVLGGGASTGDWAFSGNAAYNGTNYNQGLYFAPGGESTSYVFVPGNSESDSTALQLTNGSLTGKVAITAYNKQWQFDANGALVYPNNAVQTDTGTVQCLGNASTVVYTATGQYRHTIKLLIQVEGFVGVNDSFDTQACEMIIAKSFRANALAASVYGVVHTSVAPLATFTANWNALTGRVEVICTAPSSNSVNVRIFATEITTSD